MVDGGDSNVAAIWWYLRSSRTFRNGIRPAGTSAGAAGPRPAGAVASVCGVLYAVRYVDDLQLTYIEVFLVGAPAVLFAAAVVAVVDGAMDRTRRPRVAPVGLGALIAALALLLVLHRGLTAPGLYTTGVDQRSWSRATRPRLTPSTSI